MGFGYNPAVRTAVLGALLILSLLAVVQAQGRPAGDGPWFGLTRPTGPGAAPAVLVGARPPRPVSLPPGETAAPEFDGATLKADVQTIVQFARDSRERREVGNGQMWGRIAGFPSSDKTVEWAADQFRKAGIKDVRIQPIAQDARSALWLPLSWQVKLLGDPAFGAGTARPRARVGAAGRAVEHSRRHADGAAGLRRRGQPGGAATTST